MDTNVCGTNHLDRDILLPPRKRLLAGLKKQNSDPQSHQISPPSTSDEVDTQLNDKLNHHLSAESSRVAAIAAMNTAKAARAVAEEKALIAAKAVAAAKSALELSASVSEETTSTKNHMPVQILYNKHQQSGTSRTDELACKLHRDMRMKLLPPFEKGRIANEGIAFHGNVQSNCSKNPESGEVNSERCSLDVDTSPSRRKRGRVKLKKLSLSICAIRDQSRSPSKGNKRSTMTEDDETGKSNAGNISLFPIDISINKGGCRGFISMDMPRLQGTSMRSTK